MNPHEIFIHIHQGCFAGTGAIVRLPQCQWSKPDGYGKISQCLTTTKHSKAKTVCIFLGIYCINCVADVNKPGKPNEPFRLSKGLYVTPKYKHWVKSCISYMVRLMHTVGAMLHLFAVRYLSFCPYPINLLHLHRDTDCPSVCEATLGNMGISIPWIHKKDTKTTINSVHSLWGTVDTHA